MAEKTAFLRQPNVACIQILKVPDDDSSGFMLIN